MSSKHKGGPAPVPPGNRPQGAPADAPGTEADQEASAGAPFREQDPERRLGGYGGTGEHPRQQPGRSNDGS
jgi:hypothetical protein